ncbi:VanZ family protein [Halorubellus sp. JP-L1]|uniref:VanZ family protein n=1 Tax=Halorubellus sp. JP-L1 TaxID=2715753 RepID=UPI00140A621B|nr:VanZ family protein [Halorubellus sp. JP-L1]NHN40397.1 VanZ family protein [Halorubellus sp. JP-L1]
MPRLPLLPRFVRVGALLATLAVVVYFSLLDAPTTGAPVGPWYDKQLHFAAYAAVTVAAVGATAEARHRPRERVLGVVAFAVAFGVAIELAQWPLAGRYASWGDVLANAVGTLVGTAAFWIEARLGYATNLGEAWTD